MNTQNTFAYTRGFISVASLLIMMASLSVVMAIVYRSAQGGVITRNLKHSNEAYQQGDAAVEFALQQIRAIDDGQTMVNGIDTTKRIPENILAYADFCSKYLPSDPLARECYTFTSSPTGSVTSQPIISGSLPAVRLSEVFQVSAINTAVDTVRALRVPVTERVAPPIITHGTSNDPEPDFIRESGKITIQWNDLNTSDNQKIYDKLQIRRAEVTTSDMEELLANPTTDWIAIKKDGDVNLPLDTIQLVDETAVDGNPYAYIIKATNKDPLKLDSRYSRPVQVLVQPTP